jgi:hypothetical protein
MRTGDVDLARSRAAQTTAPKTTVPRLNVSVSSQRSEPDAHRAVCPRMEGDRPVPFVRWKTPSARDTCFDGPFSNVRVIRSADHEVTGQTNMYAAVRRAACISRKLICVAATILQVRLTADRISSQSSGYV